MTLEDAAKALFRWLSTQPISFLGQVDGLETEPQHYRLGVTQLAPESRRRVFECVPLDVPDCYEMKEVA